METGVDAVEVGLSGSDEVGRPCEGSRGEAHGQPFKDGAHLCAESVATGRQPVGRALYGTVEHTTRPAETGRRNDHDPTVPASKTLAHATAVVPGEIDGALHNICGRPFEPRRPRILGRGVAHALNQPNLEYRPPERVELPATCSHRSRTCGRRPRSWFSDDLPHANLDTDTYKAVAVDFADQQRALSARLGDEGWQGERRNDAIRAQSLAALVEPVNEALARAGLPADVIYGDDASAESLTAFLEAMPSQDVDSRLRMLRHENPEHPWTRTDLDDLAALGVALPYCHVVVTERSWAHLIRRAGLDTKYEVLVLTRLQDLILELLKKIIASRRRPRAPLRSPPRPAPACSAGRGCRRPS